MVTSDALHPVGGRPVEVLAAACPTRQVIDRIGDKWTRLVPYALGTGTLRFSELRAHGRNHRRPRSIRAVLFVVCVSTGRSRPCEHRTKSSV